MSCQTTLYPEAMRKIPDNLPINEDSTAYDDVYRGAPVAAGKKSMAYALTFQSDTKTLKDTEVAKQRQRIVRRLERELGAVLRG